MARLAWAVDLDPDYAAAYGMAAWCYARRKTHRWTTDPEWETAETARLARKALELGQDDAVALATAGYALAYVTGEVEQGAVCLDRAVELNPNLSIALGLSGWVKLWLGDLDTAIDLQAHAMRLTPRDPQSYWMESATALGFWVKSPVIATSALASTRVRPWSMAAMTSCALPTISSQTITMSASPGGIRRALMATLAK